MTEFDMSAEVAMPECGFAANHKITITRGSDVYTYWYVQTSPKCRPFDKAKDRDLIELMHPKGQQFALGQIESFTIGAERSYRLQRLGSHAFVIKSLQ
jgi:hypothetical protein